MRRVSAASVQGRNVSAQVSGEVMSGSAARYSSASRGHSRVSRWCSSAVFLTSSRNFFGSRL